MRLENYLLFEIEQGHARNMEALFRGWDEEIAAAAKALEEQKKKALEQQNIDAAQAAWIGQVIQGLVSQAASGGGDVSISIPGNLGVEGLIGGTSVAELNALIGEIEVIDNAQTGAIDSLLKGTVPKDRDIADLFGALKSELSHRTGDHGPAVDNLGAWEQVFRANDAQLAALGKPLGDPQMQIYIGAQRLEIVHHSVKLLEAHKPDRTLRLIGNPKSLLEDPSKIGAPPSIERGVAPKMGAEGFNRMLNNLPWAGSR